MKRSSLLKHGKIDIVQFVRDLPPTKHYKELFEVDIMMATVSCDGGVGVSLTAMPTSVMTRYLVAVIVVEFLDIVCGEGRVQ